VPGGGATLVVYLWGTQRWLGFGAAGLVRASPEAWLASYFPPSRGRLLKTDEALAWALPHASHASRASKEWQMLPAGDIQNLARSGLANRGKNADDIRPRPPTTVLFLDNTWVAKTVNLASTIGTPELLSIYKDPNTSDYIGWGYPSVIRETPQSPCRLIYMGYSTPKKILMAESTDCIHWSASNLGRGQQINLLFESMTEQAFVFDDEKHATHLDERFVMLLGNGSRLSSASGLIWRPTGRWQKSTIDPAFSVFRRGDGKLVAESRPPNLRGAGSLFPAECDHPGCGRHVSLSASCASWDQLGNQNRHERCLPVDNSYRDTDQIYGMPTFSYDNMFISWLWRYHCFPKPATNGNASTQQLCYTGGNVSAELAFSYDGKNFTRFSGRLTDQQPLPLLPPTMFQNGPPGSSTFGQVYPNTLLRTVGATLAGVAEAGDAQVLIHASASTHQHGHTGAGSESGAWSSVLTYGLREDGFVSCHPAVGGAGPGVLTTRPFTWGGGELSLNILTKIADGGVRVQLLSNNGSVLPGYALSDAVFGRGNQRRWIPTWQGGRSIAGLQKGSVLVIEVVITGRAQLFAMRGKMTLAGPPVKTDDQTAKKESLPAVAWPLPHASQTSKEWVFRTNQTVRFSLAPSWSMVPFSCPAACSVCRMPESL
jgi:hypothetical protein